MMVLNTRKPHRKTRTGCKQCKSRKVKCDEEKPTCKNCVSHSLPCVYLVTAASSSSAALSYPDSNSQASAHENTSVSSVAASPQHFDQISGLNMHHLELLHNFTSSTSITLSRDPELRTMWKINVPRVGFSYDFVMYAILAISALHLGRSPGKADFYLSQAKLLHENGLRLASALLPHINPENCSALYIFTALSCLITLASPRKSGDILVVGETGVSEWLIHFRGIRSVIESAPAEITSGPLGPMFIAGGRRSMMRDKHAKDATAEADQLSKLQELVRESSNNEHDLSVYISAINELQGCFNIIYAPEFQAYESADVYVWLFRILDDYLLLLNEGRQEAFAIFAFFCVVLKRFDSPWYMNGWSNHILSRLFYLLDEQHRLWIRWPIEEIGLVLY